MTLDVEQAWANPSLFSDPVIYSANLKPKSKKLSWNLTWIDIELKRSIFLS